MGVSHSPASLASRRSMPTSVILLKAGERRSSLRSWKVVLEANLSALGRSPARADRSRSRRPCTRRRQELTWRSSSRSALRWERRLASGSSRRPSAKLSSITTAPSSRTTGPHRFSCLFGSSPPPLQPLWWSSISGMPRAQKPTRTARTVTRRRRPSAVLRARAQQIQERLAARYPDVTTALGHSSAWELLVATILSAQSTDQVVNQVTPELFRRYPTVADFASAPREELEQALYRTGFFRNKAKAIQEAAQYLLEHHGGEVPERMEDLVKLPGVGRKTANVVLGSFFGRNEGLVVDTHVTRISQRLRLTRQREPEKIELDLMALVPMEEWTNFSHRLIWFGRQVCLAKDPRCDVCELEDLCPSAFKVGRWAKPAATKRAKRSNTPN